MENQTVANKLINLNVVDAGARYGLHPTWAPLANVADFYLFEIDTQEASRLNQKYSAHDNIEVVNKGLYDHAGTRVYQQFAHKGLTSLLEADQETIGRLKFMVDDYQEENKHEIQTVSIDQYFQDTEIHFLKLDTEGTELNILRGSQQQLEDSVLGVRSETHFTTVYQDQPDFGQIHRYLSDLGFDLLNLDYSGRGHPHSKFTRPDRFGQLIGCDAVWIRKIDRLFKPPLSAKIPIAVSVIRMATFLMFNHATDMAINLLLASVNQHGCDYEAYKTDPLFCVLDRQVQLLFKDLQYEPYGDDDLADVYERIFRKSLKTKHHFYESDLFT